MRRYTVAFDGGATPNPSEMKIKGWIRDPQGEKTRPSNLHTSKKFWLLLSKIRK